MSETRCGMPNDQDLTLYRLKPGVLSVDADDETILLTVDGGRYFGVRGALQPLLDSLRDGLSRGAMIDRTLARFDVTAADAAADLDRILAELMAADLIETVRAA